MRGQTRQKGFTLIELLVVIAIIGLLLSIILPSLKMAKRKAQAVICSSNLHQWGAVFLTYTTENNNKFWTEYNVWETGKPQGQWMPVLSPYYGEVDKIRLCPSADRPNPILPGLGATFYYWGETEDGGSLLQGHQVTDSTNKNYGSYGINWWINNVNPPKDNGWRAKPEVQWTTPIQSMASRIPMVMDCVWFGTNPDNTYVDGSENVHAVTSDFWETLPSNAIDWSNDISRILINRHNRGINVCFMDGSAQKVYLWDLLTLKWHKQFRSESLELDWLPH